jgi:UDP-N-acetylmuramoylalanine--D-glutamate ligase
MMTTLPDRALEGRHVGVVGLGLSGVAAAELCLGRGARVTLFDEASEDRLGPAARALGARAPLRLGPLGEGTLAGCDLLVISPGMPPRTAIDTAERAGVEVIGELELAARFLEAPIVLVGGTNGKSTVTGLLGEMLAQAGRRAFVGGNYGTPLCQAIDQGYEALVVEISSFQAERVPSLRAKVHALLNISEDHLDRYPSYQAYADAKGNPFANMLGEDVAVVPAGDEACLGQARRGAARIVTFSAALDADVCLRGAEIVDSVHGGRYPLGALRLRGRHNVANACAAVAAAAAIAVPPAAIHGALSTFAGLAHRNQLVAEIGGVRYYDDSKGTNVGASVAALGGLEEERAVLIAGGRDKQGSYVPLVEALRARGRALVVLGEAADRIAEAAAGAVPIRRVASMEEAVAVAADLARPGDAVLMSPACSSFDMFESYKARGKAFAAAVRARDKAVRPGEDP